MILDDDDEHAANQIQNMKQCNRRRDAIEPSRPRGIVRKGRSGDHDEVFDLPRGVELRRLQAGQACLIDVCGYLDVQLQLFVPDHQVIECTGPSRAHLLRPLLLDLLRERIDALDRELLALLNRRMELALEVGEIKKAERSVVFRPRSRLPERCRSGNFATP